MLLLIKKLGFPHKEDLGKKEQPLLWVTAVLIHISTCWPTPQIHHRKSIQIKSSAFRSRNSLMGTLWRQLRSQDTTEFLSCVSQVNFRLSIQRPENSGCLFHTCLFAAPGGEASKLSSEGAWRKQLKYPCNIFQIN